MINFKKRLLLRTISFVIIYSFNLGILYCQNSSLEGVSLQYQKKEIEVIFKKNSYSITPEIKKQLLDNFTLINEMISQNCVIILGDISCPSERKKNINIGLFRCRNIIDFYEKEYNIDRTWFHIVDTHYVGLEDKNCTNMRLVEIYFLCKLKND